jgi:hypothetical protein
MVEQHLRRELPNLNTFHLEFDFISFDPPLHDTQQRNNQEQGYYEQNSNS